MIPNPNITNADTSLMSLITKCFLLSMTFFNDGKLATLHRNNSSITSGIMNMRLYPSRYDKNTEFIF